jgi:Transposase.
MARLLIVNRTGFAGGSSSCEIGPDMTKTTNKFSPEVRARAIRMVLDHEAAYPSRGLPVSPIAAKIGCSPAMLHEWVKKSEVNSGKRAGLPSDVA